MTEQERQERLKMDYLSERIVNLQDLQDMLIDAHVFAQFLLKESEKENPSMDRINRLSIGIRDLMRKAIDFDYRIEVRRVTPVD